MVCKGGERTQLFSGTPVVNATERVTGSFYQPVPFVQEQLLSLLFFQELALDAYAIPPQK